MPFFSQKKDSYVSRDDALIRLQKWCAGEERATSTAKKKLYEWKIYGDDADQIITTLIEDDFLNEARFASAYVIGKFRQNNWGRIKITQGLKMLNVSKFNIANALSDIDEADYLAKLLSLLEKKMASMGIEKITFENKAKLVNYALQKGYEQEIIYQTLGKMPIL